MKRIVLLFACLWLMPVHAGGDNVRVWAVDKTLTAVYKVVYQHLESNNFFVVFEPDIQDNLSHFAERWGEDYNRNKLEGIRAMVFCNGWYANQVSNADPDMLAMCPLHITLVQQLGQTRILFVRPSVVAAGSKAQRIARELEDDVVKAVDAAINELRGCPAAC
ncbi:MAG: DUF302 domain-containing protein [Thiogranum sp.]